MKDKFERPVCSVADQHCDAAANYEERPIRISLCVTCGEDVCKKCSSIRTYKGFSKQGLFENEWTKVRMCNTCQTSMDGNDEIVIKRLVKLGEVR